MFAQFAIGFLTGLLLGLAVFSHALSRAVVLGFVAGGILGALMIDGVEGYVRWATHLPVEATRLSAFSIGMIAGVVCGAGYWAERRIL
jgi:hypothetical protein